MMTLRTLILLILVWAVPALAEPTRISNLEWVFRDPPKATSYTIDAARDVIGIIHHIDEWQGEISLDHVADALYMAGAWLARERDFRPGETLWLSVLATEGNEHYLLFKVGMEELAGAKKYGDLENPSRWLKRQRGLLNLVTVELIGPKALQTARSLCRKHAREVPRFCAQAVQKRE